MRVMCVALSLLVAGGCASTSGAGSSSPHRTVSAVILGALMVGGAALAVGAAAKSRDVGRKLDADVKRGEVDGSDFIDRDAEGRRWNRIGRASAFLGGLAAIGLGIVWEMSLGDRADGGATEPPHAQTERGAAVVKGLSLPGPLGALPGMPLAKRGAVSVLFSSPADQRSATAR